MAQATRTSCAHNAAGQVVRSDVAVACRKCGALIKATPRSVQANQQIPSEKQIDAAYPGDGSTANQAWAFAQ